MSSDLINVGVADLKLGHSVQILRTILGSCVGICLYDRQKKIGGLAHILLPDSKQPDKPEKYATTAIPMLIDLMLKQGCKREFMTAKIAGGSSMFKLKVDTPLGQIGKRNIEAVKKILSEKKIPVVAEDFGGSVGRVLDFFVADGHLKIKAASKEQNFYKV